MPSARLPLNLRRVARGAVAALTMGAMLASVAHAEPHDWDFYGPGADRGAYVESGIASTYGSGDGFQGSLTACGQRFDTNVVQVAHKSLPCGTLLRIEDQESGNSVLAQVTDRGPYVRGRIVDLSWAAYSQLDPQGPGLLNVSIYRLS